jgi:S1-C subfamily serine protease
MNQENCINDYKKLGYTEIEKSPAIGITFSTELDKPAIIKGLMPSGPAYAAGLKIGDVIIKINNRKIDCLNDVMSERNKFNVGDIVYYTILRNNENFVFKIQLVSMAEILKK